MRVARLVLATSLLAAGVGGPTAHAALGSCGAGLPALGTTSGVLSSPGYTDYWYTTPSSGAFTITLSVSQSVPTVLVGPPREIDPDIKPNTDIEVALYVFDETCNSTLCAPPAATPTSPATCSVSSPQPVNIWIHFDLSVAQYTLSVAALPTVGGCGTVASQLVCASATATAVRGSYAVTTSPVTATARIDAYAFTLPNGGIVTIPCVVVTSPVPADPCGAAGGTSTSTLQRLTDTLSAPSAPPGTPFAGISVCDANVTVTVNNLGVNSFPALVVC